MDSQKMMSGGEKARGIYRNSREAAMYKREDQLEANKTIDRYIEDAKHAGKRTVPDYAKKIPVEPLWEGSREHDMLADLSISQYYFKQAHRRLAKKINALGPEVTNFCSEINKLIGKNEATLPKDVDDVRIGLTHLRVPPERIHIDELSDLKHMAGLRSGSASVVNTGRSVIRISLDVVFPTDADVFMKDAADEKNTLEYLITQFLTLPFTTITSKYISWLVQKELISPKEDDSVDLDSQIAQKTDKLYGVGRQIAKTLVTLQHMYGVDVTNNQEYADALAKGLALDLESIQANTSASIVGALRLACAILLTESRKDGDKKKEAKTLIYSLKLKTLMTSLRYTLDEVRALINQKYDTTKWEGNQYPPVVPVAFQSINFYPEPETTQTVRAQLEFVSLITTPYVEDYMWRDPLGRPTPYIEQCSIYEKLVKYRKQGINKAPFEQELKTLKDRSSNEAQPNNRELFSIFHYRNKIEAATKADADFIKDLPLYKRAGHFGPQVANRLDLSGGFHPVSFGLTLTNQLAMQPILGSVYGTVQYTGTRLGRFHLSILTTDDEELKRIHRMESDVKGLASYGIAEWRRTMLHIVNPYLKMAGMEFFELESVSTSPVPGSTNVTKVDMRLTQYGAFPEKNTKRFAGYRKLLDKASVKKGLEFLWNKFQKLHKHLHWTYTLRLEKEKGFISSRYGKTTEDQTVNRKKLVAEYDTIARILFGPSLVNRIKDRSTTNDSTLFVKRTTRLFRGTDDPRYPFADWGRFNKTQGLLSPFVLSNAFTRMDGGDPESESITWATQLLSLYKDAVWPVDANGRDARARGYKMPTLDGIATYIADFADTKYYSYVQQKQTRIPLVDHGMYAPAQMAMKTLYDAAADNRVEGLQAVVDMEEADRPMSERVLRSGALYPDLQLPPIHYALSEVIEVVTRNTAADSTTKIELDSFDQLTDAQKLIIKRFLPKYADLGAIPDDGVVERIAPNPKDLISPDLPWAWTRTKGTLLVDSQGDQLLTRTAKKSEVNGAKMLDTAGAQAEHKRFSDQGFVATKEAKDLIGINSDMLSTREYHLNEVGDEGHKWEPSTPNNIKKMVKYALLRDKDNHLALIRAFPTFKLLFIAENKKGWQVYDDVYSYNSVISINVTNHEYQTSIAEIVLTNISGSLTMDGFNQEEGRLPSKRQTKRSVPQNVRDDKTVELTRFPLQQGTRVAIMMGYGSDIHGMETVFTGKVAEVSGTEMLHVIAQGYLMELTKPVGANFRSKDKTHDIVFSAMEAANPEHFGRWHPSAWKDLNPTELSNGKNLSLFGSRYERVIAKPYMRNVFVSNYTSWWTKKLVDTLAGESWDSGGGTKTAWDLIQETTLYSPGYIARVVPYDLEATLFWGRPDQLYYHTDGRRLQEKKWLKKRTKEVKVVAPQEVLDKFTFSEEYGKEKYDYETVFNLVRERNVISYREYATISYIERAKANHLPFTGRGTRPDYPSKIKSGKLDEGYKTIRLWAMSKEMLRDKTRQLRSIEGMLGTSEVSGYIFAAFFDSLIYSTDTSERYASYDWSIFGKIYKASELAVARSKANYRAFKMEAISRRDLSGSIARSYIKQGIFPGTMMINLPAWQQFVAELAKDIKGPTFAPNPILIHTSKLRNTVGEILRRHMQIHGGGVQAGKAMWHAGLASPLSTTSVYETLADNKPIAAEAEAAFIHMMDQARPLFHAFLHFFDIWLKANPFDWLPAAAEIEMANSVADISPRMRPFREYHAAIDAWDIISNDISCSTGSMWNSVLVTNGTSQPEIIDVSDHLKSADKIVRVFNEPNADLDIYNMASETNVGPVNNRVLVGNSRVAQGIRKMYRGQLVLRGNPRIRPSDIVYIYDLKNMIWGPIEVERVTHTFNSQDGYTTTIKPKCYVEVNNYDGGLASILINTMYDAAGLAIPLLAGAVVAGSAGFSPMGLAIGIGAWQSARKLTDRSIAYCKRNKLLTAVVGGPTWADQHTPVRIYPLSRMGGPWVAGLAGMLETGGFTSYFAKEFDKDWSDAGRGVSHLWETIEEYILGFEDRDDGSSD